MRERTVETDKPPTALKQRLLEFTSVMLFQNSLRNLPNLTPCCIELNGERSSCTFWILLRSFFFAHKCILHLELFVSTTGKTSVISSIDASEARRFGGLEWTRSVVCRTWKDLESCCHQDAPDISTSLHQISQHNAVLSSRKYVCLFNAISLK